jgi:hypothetical protein
MELDNCGRATKNDHRRIDSIWVVLRFDFRRRGAAWQLEPYPGVKPTLMEGTWKVGLDWVTWVFASYHKSFLSLSCDQCVWSTLFALHNVNPCFNHGDGRFSVSASCRKISNPDSLSSIETMIAPEVRSWKKLFLNELNVRKPLVSSILRISEELRLNNVVLSSTIPNPGLKTVS